MFEKCTQRPDQYFAPLTSLLQHSDLHKATSVHLAAHHSGTFPEALNNSPGFCRHLPVQSSLPESRSFCTTALALDEQAGPDISLLSPLLQSQWDHPRNAHLGNAVIKPQSAIKVWWTCSQCPDGHSHNWLAKPTKAPHLVPEWSDDNHRSPHDFAVSSHEKAWWRCNCGCGWEATIKSWTTLGSGCPDCAADRRSGKHRRHSTLTESQHEMLQLWDWELNKEAGLDPGKLTCRSGKKAHWLCNKCPVGQPHRWQATVSSVYTSTVRGTSGCPRCEGLQACKCNSLQSLFPWVAAEWDYERNKGTPAGVAAYSSKYVWWHNSHRGHFKARIHGRSHGWTLRQQAGQVRQVQPASPCDVSPTQPAYKTVSRAALASPAV